MLLNYLLKKEHIIAQYSSTKFCAEVHFGWKQSKIWNINFLNDTLF